MNKKLTAIILSILIFCICFAGENSGMNNFDSPFGALEFLHWDHPWNNYKYHDEASLKKAVRLMKEAGISWARIDFLWGDIEPQQGVFKFAKYDQIVEALTAEGINILGILHYSADWASSCGAWNCPPKDNKLFVNYAINVAGRYKYKVKFWEIWNEPDSGTYWKPQDGLKSYCVLLKDVYYALKKIDPECVVLNGGLAEGIGSVNRLYDNGAKDFFDILNIHIFQSPLNPGAVHAVTSYPKIAYKIMKRNGDGDKKIWVTEIGCPGIKKGSNISNWWMGENPDEAQQAEWVKQVYRGLLADSSVTKVFWAFFRDCQGHWGNGIDYFGLIRWDYSKKPSFKAYRQVVDEYKKGILFNSVLKDKLRGTKID